MKKIVSEFNLKNLSEHGTFSGYGSVFNNEDFQNDVVQPGAFASSLERHTANDTMPALLLHHDSQRPCGVYTVVKEDRRGLYVEGELLLSTTDGRDAYELLKAGALTGLSVGYQTIREEFDHSQKVNFLKEVDLWEISLVTFPANDQARVSSVKTPRDFEKFLCSSGFSRNQAKNITCQGFKKNQAATIENDIQFLLQDSIKILQ